MLRIISIFVKNNMESLVDEKEKNKIYMGILKKCAIPIIVYMEFLEIFC
jgi:hypothetical protein